jgi:hypothetical protein
MTSFSSSEALRFAGAEGGGAGVTSATAFVELGWPWEKPADIEKPSRAARITEDRRSIRTGRPG